MLAKEYEDGREAFTVRISQLVANSQQGTVHTHRQYRLRSRPSASEQRHSALLLPLTTFCLLSTPDPRCPRPSSATMTSEKVESSLLGFSIDANPLTA